MKTTKRSASNKTYGIILKNSFKNVKKADTFLGETGFTIYSSCTAAVRVPRLLDFCHFFRIDVILSKRKRKDIRMGTLNTNLRAARQNGDSN